MPEIPSPPVPTQLIVFADDWGRHPSSSQHLIRELLPQYPTLWVNTIGTRRPRLGLADIKRVYDKVKWQRNPFARVAERVMQEQRPNLHVIQPLMYPGFRTPMQRRFNAGRLAKAVNAHLLPSHRHVVITTLPITADLPGRIKADRWLYYCVDDYAQWPGVDLKVMQAMERELLPRMDGMVAVSKVLQKHLQAIDPSASPVIIVHGVEEDLWDGRRRESWNAELNPNDPLDDPFRWYEPPKWVAGWRDQRVALFWGLIDSRLDIDWLKQLHQAGAVDQVVLVGPSNAPPDGLNEWTEMPGNVGRDRLPACAAASNVLIMPYIDAPVTRAMQPLKLLEYLATMKPVVVRDLPATRAWADCCDLADNAQDFVRLVEHRIQTGTPTEQLEARKRRLPGESWTAKAAQLAAIINQR